MASFGEALVDWPASRPLRHVFALGAVARFLMYTSDRHRMWANSAGDAFRLVLLTPSRFRFFVTREYRVIGEFLAPG